jgi:hypothetical protein
MSFEDIFPSTTPRYRYEGIQQCLQILEQEQERLDREGRCDPYLIVNAIDERSFLELGSERDLRKSCEAYDHSSHQVLINIAVSSEHAVAGGTFNTIFTIWAHNVINTPLLNTGRRSVRGQTRTKNADLSWTLRDPPGGRSLKWPTLAVEVAFSEPRRKVEQDADFWLRQSGGEVKAVLSITVHRHGKITIEKWDLLPTPAGIAPRPTQTIEIVRNPAPNCPRIQGQLQLQFQDLFLRNKQKEETDFIFSYDDMEEIASDVWRFQFDE